MPPKRRRRFHGLYYHSSPPKVMPMNGQTGGLNGSKRRSNDDFSVKLSTIRIWMHEKDIGKLTRILWAGQGHRLCQQASNNGRVKRFLAAVPHVMNAIKDLHQAVIDNNLETVQAQLEPPVAAALVTCKDGNGLNVIHKAAGLGHTKILEYLVGLWPEGAHEMDITGKTPLHWAASAKNNMRCYTLLTQAGCDEEALDYKMKTPSYYRHKPHEIERAFLVYVPEAPRVSPESTTDWEALSDESGDNSAGGDAASKKSDIKVAPTVNGRKSLDDSIENTSELDTNDGTSANDEEDDLSKADVDVDVEVDVDGDAVPEPAEVPALQRRPETPATFNNGHINGDDNEGDTEGDSEATPENIASAVSGGKEGGEETAGQGGEEPKEQEQEQSAATEEANHEEAATEQEQEPEQQQQQEPATGSELKVNEKTEEAQPETEPEGEVPEAAAEEAKISEAEVEVEQPVPVAEQKDSQDPDHDHDQDNVEENDDDDDEVHFGVL